MDFHIRLKTSSPVTQPVLLPPEDSGKFVRLLKGRLCTSQSGRLLGGVDYLDNPRYLIQPRQVSWLSLRLRQVNAASIPLNASLFHQVPSADSENRPIASTGAYANYVAGVMLAPVKLRPSPQGYILVVSAATTGAVANVDYELLLFSDHPVDISQMPG